MTDDPLIRAGFGLVLIIAGLVVFVAAVLAVAWWVL